MAYNLYEKYGPIISDEESDIIHKDLDTLITNGEVIKINFEGVIAMSTKSAKKVFGSLYGKLNPTEFYEKVQINNASKTLQEIIYDSIINYISTSEIKK